MIIWGEEASFKHEANGMTEGDIKASAKAADDLDEIIVFRSSGPWCKRWIDWKHPTKNFHVKGKSSDWGPHAGLVPFDGVYSKVGADPGKAAKGTQANKDGIASGFSGTTPLVMKKIQIDDQRIKPEGGKNAIQMVWSIPNSRDLLLVAQRSGAGATRVMFRACFNEARNEYTIKVWSLKNPVQNIYQVMEKSAKDFDEFLVMTSCEVGANNLPLTGDYDLMAVCPTFGQYGSKTSRVIRKAGIHLENGQLHNDLSFDAGVGMDNVMDTRFHTMGKATANAALPLVARGASVQYNAKGEAINRLPNMSDFHDRQKYYQQGSGFSSASLNVVFDNSKDREHQDMGNLTPRILRCINKLNEAMGATGDKSALRRVHHNAESHRNRKWAAITEIDMRTKKDGDKFTDGFPMSCFHPKRLLNHGYFENQVCTVETLDEFKLYSQKVKEAGFYMPKNWIWNI